MPDWFDERAEIEMMGLKRALGVDLNAEPRFMVMPDYTFHRYRSARLNKWAGDNLEKQCRASESMLNWAWNQQVVERFNDMDGKEVERREWTPEKAVFSVTTMHRFEETTDSVPDILVTVRFPEGSEGRDFEKFWCDFVWPELPSDYNPVGQSFKGGWDDIQETSTLFRYMPDIG